MLSESWEQQAVAQRLGPKVGMHTYPLGFACHGSGEGVSIDRVASTVAQDLR